MNSKKVIIIEDDFDDFKNIREYLDSFCDCYPDVKDDDSDDFESFISLFQRFLNSGEKKYIRNLKKNALFNRLQEYGKDVSYIIDYALKKNDTENVTGKKFYEMVINELYPDIYVPTLMLTGIDFNIDVLNRIHNDLTLYRDKINTEAGNKVFEYFRKDFKSISSFKQYVIDFIKNTDSIPRPKILEQKIDFENHPMIFKINEILKINYFIVSDVTDDKIQKLFNHVKTLKSSVIKHRVLLDNPKLITLLDNFNPPHDAQKITVFIANTTEFLNYG